MAYGRCLISLGTLGHFEEPLITEISGNIDVLAACYDRVAERLDFTLSRRADRSGPARLTIANVPEDWTIEAPGPAGQLASRRAEGGIEVELDVAVRNSFKLGRAAVP